MKALILDHLKKEAARVSRVAELNGNRLVISEGAFAEELCRERKRAERSGHKFTLMLVEKEAALERLEAGMLTLLASQLRETDVVGWHRTGVVAGAILTEFGDRELAPALAAIRSRVKAELHAQLPEGAVNSLRITFHNFPDQWDAGEGEYRLDSALHPDLRMHRNHGLRKDVKRAVDIIGSLGALVLLSPLFGAIALAVRLTSKGPALFRQQRIGQFGRLFTMYKFRSMQLQAAPDRHQHFVEAFINENTIECGTGGIYKLTDDPRITRFGKFLRRTSLDELPQFFNVLRGEMSLVGPRPPLFYEVQAYRAWHRRRLLEAKPGLTGLWQVSGRSRTRFNEMVRLDLRYARTQSVWLDMSLLVKTLRVLVSDEGAV